MATTILTILLVIAVGLGVVEKICNVILQRRIVALNAYIDKMLVAHDNFVHSLDTLMDMAGAGRGHEDLEEPVEQSGSVAR